MALTDKEIVEQALEHWRMSDKAFNATRSLSADDLRFEAGYDEHGRSTQWESNTLDLWKAGGDPALTLDQIGQFCNQVVNEWRQARPSIKVFPVDSGADIQTAKIIRGIIRSIEQVSHASVAYDTAQEHAAKCGIGFCEIAANYAYEEPKNRQEFNAQELRIMRVRNPFTISYDPSSEQVDGSDWDFCLKTEDLPRDIFLRKYKESQIASLSSWSAEGNYPPGWMTSESVRVASYYYADYGKEKAYLLSDGSVVLKSILDGNMAKYGDNGLLRGVSVIKEREIPSRKIKWAKITAVEPLEQTDWPGKYIPIVPFIGNELVLDGKYIQYGVIRKVKETMKAMNYMVSSAVKSIGLMPKNPVYAPIETLTAFKDMYEVANKKSFAALPYLSYDKEGRSLPPPSRQPFEPAIQSFNQMVFLFQGLLKGSIGLYGPSLGEPSNETSGLAIQSRKIQGTQATFHLQANAERSMWHTGRILVDLIPKYYDHGQVVQIIGEDDKAAQVMLDRNIPESPQERENAAEENRYNIHVGRYDVEISVVPGAATRRQENLGRVSEILKTWPNLLPSVGHILFRNMDLDGAEEIANELLEMKKRNQGALPPQIQQQLAGMQKMIQALQQELRDAKIREAANIYEVESRERTELVKADLATAELRAKVATTIGQMESKESLALLDAKLRSIEEKIAELKKPAAVQLQQEQQPEEQPVS